MDLLFFINSFHFIMPILLSLPFISVLETVLAMIHHIKSWETVQSIRLGKKASSPFQEQQLQHTELWHCPKTGIMSAENSNNSELFWIKYLIQDLFSFFKCVYIYRGKYWHLYKQDRDRNRYTAGSRLGCKENMNFCHVLAQC